MAITSWELGAQKVQEVRDNSMLKVPKYVKEEDLPEDLGHNVLDVPKKILTPRELEITEGYEATSLVKALQTGKLTATEVTKAFLRRATLAQRLVNCVSEFLAEEALARAAELDEYFQKHGKPIGPLHGLPMSVKDHFGMEGKLCCLGFTALADRYAAENADVLVMMRKLGAIFHVRTTQPQMLMSIDTTSKVWGGPTVTPYNRNLTAGGSSGGEGALLAMRGSVLGFGTDIGGSVRVPAAACGVWGFRPSVRRMPYGGVNMTGEGSEQILCTVGPMSTSLSGCELFLKMVEDSKPWTVDPYCLRMPWRELPKPNLQDLKIGVMWWDEIVRPHPPVTRVLKDSVAKLQAAGASITEWKPYQHKRCWEIIAGLYYIDNGITDKALMEQSKEPWLPLSEWILSKNPYAKDRSIAENCDLVAERDRYKKEYMKMLNESGLDFILCPATIGASMPVQKSRSWAYTAQWNLLDYPAVVFPAGQVDTAKDVKDAGYVPVSEEDKFFHELYDPKTFEDAPVGLQLVARTYHDEELARAMEVVWETLSEVTSEAH